MARVGSWSCGPELGTRGAPLLEDKDRELSIRFFVSGKSLQRRSVTWTPSASWFPPEVGRNWKLAEIPGAIRPAIRPARRGRRRKAPGGAPGEARTALRSRGGTVGSPDPGGGDQSQASWAPGFRRSPTGRSGPGPGRAPPARTRLDPRALPSNARRPAGLGTVATRRSAPAWQCTSCPRPHGPCGIALRPQSLCVPAPEGGTWVPGALRAHRGGPELRSPNPFPTHRRRAWSR